MGGFNYRSDRADFERRIEHVLDLFPVLAARRGSGRRTRCRVASSSCSPWASRWLHEPEMLIIDELSLGLAPDHGPGLVQSCRS